MATEYITSIKGKIKGVDLKKGLQELEKFGFGKFEIKLIGKNKIIIENNNNPFSIDYRTIFGKKGEAKETLIIMILQKLLAQGNVKTEITQKMSITKGQSKNIYVINIKK